MSGGGVRVIVAGLIPLAVSCGLLTGQIRGYHAPGDSMAPTIEAGERFIADGSAYDFSRTPERGDIVVFQAPPPDVSERTCRGEGLFVTRVVALAGETIEIRRGRVNIDGKWLREPYLHPTQDTSDFPRTAVPPERIFVLGDNRTHSSDSRVYGPIPLEFVCSKVVQIFG